MTEKSLLWTTSGGTGDAEASGYTGEQLFQLFRSLFTGRNGSNYGGVAPNFGSELAVTGSSSPLAVGAGAALVYGIPYWSTASENVAVPTPATLDRTDLIVLRASWAAQTVRITRVAGTEGAGAPSLTQSASTTWDIPLAQVTVSPGGVFTLVDTRQFLRLVGDGEIGETQIADGAVTKDKVATNAVGSDELLNNAVTSDKISADAVNGSKIADDSIDSEHYVDGSIDNAHLANDAVNGSKIADDSIDSEHYVDGSIDTAHLGDLQVTGGKIAAATIDPATKLNGTNGVIANVSDGNARGADAVDLQTSRSAATAVASAQESVIGGGVNNTASGAQGTVAGGSNNVASGQQSAVAGGGFNQATAIYSVVPGGAKAVAGKRGQWAFAGGVNSAGTAGAQQISTSLLATGTSNNSQTEMFLDGEGGSARLTIPSDTTWMFRASIVARRTDADGESAAYVIEGCIDNNAGTTALVGTITKTVLAEDTSAWDVTAEADNANDALVVKVTGENAKSINWLARVDLVELTG